MQRSGWLLLVAIAAISYGSPTCWAQAPDSIGDPAVDADMLSPLPSDSSVTPEMWFYLKEYQRYQSPKEAVRRKAEVRASQRQARLESQRWFGFSNLRPIANPIPYYGSYSPFWSGSPWNSFGWSGYGQPYVTYHTATQRR